MLRVTLPALVRSTTAATTAVLEVSKSKSTSYLYRKKCNAAQYQKTREAVLEKRRQLREAARASILARF